MVQLRAIGAVAVLAVITSAQDPVARQPLHWVTNSSPETGLLMTITNKSPLPITALSVQTKFSDKNGRRGARTLYFDSLVNVNKDRPLRPNETRVFSLIDPATLALISEFKVEPLGPSAVLSDGSVFGPADRIRVLKGRRELIRDDLERYTASLESLRSGRATPKSVISRLTGDVPQTSAIAMQPGKDPEVLLAQGFVARFLSMTIEKATSQPCASGDCDRRYYDGIAGYSRKWLADLNNATGAGKR